MKKIIIISAAVILFSLVFQVIYYTSTHAYNYVEGKKLSLDKIINQNYLDSIVLTTAVGSYYDTLFQIKYRHYCLLVWNISNYHNVTQGHIKFNRNGKNRNYYMTPYSNREMSPVLSLTYKLPRTIPERISINLSPGSEIYDSLGFEQKKGYCIRTERFGIGSEKERSNIIFNIKGRREIILMIYNKTILVFYSYDSLKIENAVFTDIINYLSLP